MESEIVVTGISGRFPESDNIAEFSKNLYNKVDLITESTRRWEPGLHGLPKYMGQIKDISKFDAGFFGVHHKQAHQLDPQARMLLETTHEAIVDAGYDPAELRGRTIGVYVGNCISESEEFFTSDPKKINGYGMTGCCRAMFANRISYSFDFKGPSILMDTACSSGAVGLYEAVRAIKNNECEAAIVSAANLCLRPGTSLQFFKLNMLSTDGRCKSFDEAGNGYGRSEAVVSLFIQKASVARRIYASIVHIKTNTDGHKEQGVTFPSAHMQKRLIQEVYEECRLNPLKVSYVEAHGTGTPAGDPIEMGAIADVFCKGRKEPLLVGSLKSNMGHSEPTSGLCSLVKVLIAMENKLLPPNLHFKKPNSEIPALVNGQVKIVTEAVPWEGEYASISCFGFGGVNVHAVLKSNSSQRSLQMNTATEFPRLVLYSGRTEESVETMFDYLDQNSTPSDFFGLLHKSVYSTPALKPFRGYKVMDKENGLADVKLSAPAKRPVWYIFSGMGTQWPAMGRDLMKLEIFAKTIHRLADVLKPHGLDLIELLTNGVKNNENRRSIIPSFVSIAAVQVALVDVLSELGIEPDGMVGHSVGELGCAYADGCFTGEQMVLAAYWRGKAVEDSNLEEGAMAALGLTWSEAKRRCPELVYPSCHNADDSITISGNTEKVHDFVELLKAENIFAREVDSCGYAFHSRYIFPAAEKLQSSLEKVIPKPKPRTARWVTSSFPEKQWNEQISKFADATYFVHNLISPVLFREALSFVPKDAVVIEIAPHHLLQAILKRVIGPEAEYIGLMKRNSNNSIHLLSSIGRMYVSGLNPQVEKLYPPVSFPVSPGTPMISPLVKWDHSESWCFAKWGKSGNHSQMIVDVDVGSEDSGDAYLLDHRMDGRALYPATGYLVLVWRALAEQRNKSIESMPVVFENVKIHRATVLSKTNVTKLMVDITSAGGEFEISEAGATVVTGHVYASDETSEMGDCSSASNPTYDSDSDVRLNSTDVYKELRLRGYEYGPSFQGVLESDLEGAQGILKWADNWVVFLDTILHFCMLSHLKRALLLPTRIEKIKINPLLHKQILEKLALGGDFKGIPIKKERFTNYLVTGGVEMKNPKSSVAPRQPCRQNPLLEEYSFIPYKEANILSEPQLEAVNKYIHVCSTVSKKILESAGKNKDQITEVMNGFHEVDENVFLAYLQNLSSNQVLLKNLQYVLQHSESSTLHMTAKKALSSYLEEKEADLLENLIEDELPLRRVLDVIVENSASRKLHVLELHDGKLPLSSKIHQIFQTFSTLQLNYTIAHPKPDIILKDGLPSANVRTISWSLSSSLPDVKETDLLVVKNLNCSKKDLTQAIEKFSSIVKDNGFILIVQRTKLVPAELFLSAVSETVIPVHSETELEKVFQELKLVTVCKKSDSLVSSLYLLRKSPKEVSSSDSVVYVKTGLYDTWVEQLKSHLLKIQSEAKNSRIWLVSEGDSQSGIVGLANCLRQEPGGTNIRCVFIDADGGSKPPKFRLDDTFYRDISQKNLAMNVFQKGVWGSYRHSILNDEQPTVISEHAYLNVMVRGDLSSLRWIDSPLKHFSSSPPSNAVLCQVYYAPLNFRDVMLASGKLPPDAIPGDLALQDCILGLEFSGRNMRGKKIMGLVSAKGLATTVAADPDFLWDVPDNWTLEEASTVPVAYSTAYYALITRGNLKRGERVLIHSGSGGVGQAAIGIALDLGCEVFTTVGTAEKKEFLKKRFPKLKDSNFCNSRDTSFEQHILNVTKGEGVDVVLNSLADEKMKASLNCLAQHGRFLEIGKYDLSNNSSLGMALFLKNVSFHGILLDALFEKKASCESTKKEVVDLVKEGIKKGTVKPLNSILFNHDEVEQAFRYMASGRHIGKVVLKIREEEALQHVLPSPVYFPALSRTLCHPNKTYIIIGGLGGFGLELCQWLVDRGARNIILTSRSGVRTGYQHLCLKRCQAESVNVVASNLNASIYKDAEQLLRLAAAHGPVAGIFNLALVLRDAFMENQTVENFRAVCESKVQSTVNLDGLSRDLCPELELFVCFSSVSCGRGNAGQSNYGFANSVMERICEKRNNEGLCGLAIEWGAIGDVGVIQDTVGSEVVIGGTVPQRITSCLSVMDQFLKLKQPVVSSLVPYKPVDTAAQKTSKHNVLAIVANVFGIKDISTINPESNLGELGMDSLMGVEIQQFLEREHELVLSIQELRQMKVKDLKRLDSVDGSGESDTKTEKLDKVNELSSVLFKHLVPTETVIPLNKNKKGVPLFIVHPIEGVASMLETIGKSVMCPLYGLQHTVDAPAASIEELALWYLCKISEMKISDTIHLAGYSFGASVAFEMALQVERNPKMHPKVATVLMLDGSPSLVTSYTRTHESHFLVDSQTEGEAQALCSFILQFSEANIKELREKLLSLANFEERIGFTADMIAEAYPNISKDNISSAFDLYYKKLLISLKYTPKRKLRRDITLIKAMEVVDLVKAFSEQYNLEKVCSGKIAVHTVDGNHKTFIQGKSAKKVADIINDFI